VHRSDALIDPVEWEGRDLVYALLRRWWVVALVTLATGLTTAAVMVMMPRTYGAVVTLRIGHVGDRRLFDSPEVATQATSYDVGARLAAAGLYPASSPESVASMLTAAPGSGIPGVDTAPPTPTAVQTGYVTVRAQCGSPDEAKRLAKAVAGLLLREHQRRFEDTARYQRAYRDRLQAQIDAARADAAKLDEGLRGAPQGGNSAALLIGVRREEKLVQIQALDRELRDLDILLSVNSETTTSVGEPVVLMKLTTPRRTVTTLAGAILGGLLGIFWVLLTNTPRRPAAVTAASRHGVL
jgi:uncharacterized protein involved in exopolysaccharide biosynthesis